VRVRVRVRVGVRVRVRVRVKVTARAKVRVRTMARVGVRARSIGGHLGLQLSGQPTGASPRAAAQAAREAGALKLRALLHLPLPLAGAASLLRARV